MEKAVKEKTTNPSFCYFRKDDRAGSLRIHSLFLDAEIENNTSHKLKKNR